jgi:hypothetical protein
MSSNQPIDIQPRPAVRQINYAAKTFTDFRQNFIDFARAYYPNTYADFNEASPGMMFIEMAAYLGDVLSFYIDNQFKENLLAYAEEPENVVTIAQFLGYKPRLVSPASTEATLYQIVPAILVNGQYVPDPKYLLKVGRGSVFLSSTQPPVPFILSGDVDFSQITTENYIANTYTSGNPDTYIVSKPARLISATQRSTTFTFGAPQKFTTVLMPDESIIGIESVVDSNGNTWYEVDYLAQDVIFDDLAVADNGETGMMPTSKLRLRKVPRRFVTKINRDGRMELMFGSGTSDEATLDFTLDSRQIATSQYGSVIQNVLENAALNNVNFLNSTSFGVAPNNVTLTVQYWVGGGVTGNVPSRTINSISELLIRNDTTDYTPEQRTLFDSYVRSVTINNEFPATGGGNGESTDEIRENALAFFNAQNRVVTAEDYVVRTYALPSRYGQIAKAMAVRDEQINRILASNDDRQYVENLARPNCINLYTLGLDKNGNLANLNTIVKENLARYLEQYRLLTDDINILDAFVINIGVDFDISVLQNYNVNDVLVRSIGAVQDFFDIEKWNIGQPIILTDLMYKIGLVEGVRAVRDVRITNKYQFQDGIGYQPYRYDISDATVNGVIYPSLDPSIFELKYPQTDIIGNATQ